MSKLDQLLDEAMELAEADRVTLAGLLLDSCEERDPRWWESVAPEVRQRLAAVDAGGPTLTYDAVRSRMYERIRAAGH